VLRDRPVVSPCSRVLRAPTELVQREFEEPSCEMLKEALSAPELVTVQQVEENAELCAMLASRARESPSSTLASRTVRSVPFRNRRKLPGAAEVAGTLQTLAGKHGRRAR
jgi:hypothetical protein